MFGVSFRFRVPSVVRRPTVHPAQFRKYQNVSAHTQWFLESTYIPAHAYSLTRNKMALRSTVGNRFGSKLWPCTGQTSASFFVQFNTKAPCVAERYFFLLFLPVRKMWQQTASQRSRNVIQAGKGQPGSTVGLRHPDIRAPCPSNTCYMSLHTTAKAIFGIR
jgi:hypothetical protein